MNKKPVLSCSACALRKNCKSPVPGDGIARQVGRDLLRVMVVGEAPGYNEDEIGKPFMGLAGLDLNRYLHEYSGIWRNQVYVTNVVKCRPLDNRDPKPEEIAACRKHLDAEIEFVKPDVIVTVGGFATRSFLDIGSMDARHGIPSDVELNGRRVTIFPCYHTALGLHDIRKTTAIKEDFKKLGALLKKGAGFQRFEESDRWSHTNYTLVEGSLPTEEMMESPVIEYHDNGDKVFNAYMGIDSEWESDGSLWSIQVSCSPGTGYVIPASNKEAMRDLADFMNGDHDFDYNIVTVVHNANADIPRMLEAGLPMPETFHDTLVMADVIQKEPKGLKALSERFCGVRMKSYKGVVDPAQKELATEYLQRIAKHKLPKPKMRLEWDYVPEKGRSLPKYRKPWSMNRRVDRILADMEQGKKVDPYERWKNIAWEDGRGEVESNPEFGPMPRADLSHVNPKDAIAYAARDADMTLRVLPHLMLMLRRYDLTGTYGTDMKALRHVLDMEKYGMRVDVEHFKKLSVRFEEEMRKSGERINELSKDHVNPGSPVQVADLLYKKLEMPRPLREPNSTNSKYLRPLVIRHPVVPEILNYREFKKLKSSFSDPIYKTALASREKDRVRSSLRVSGAETGRMTSRRPNLMNQPSRSETGRLVREGFIAPEGMVMIHSDFGKMDFTIMADCSEDERMCKIMWDFWAEPDPEKQKDKDLHAITAYNLFGVKPREQDKYAHRLPAKTTGFGVAFGLSPVGLQGVLLNTAATLEDGPGKRALMEYEDVSKCEAMIDAWFESFSGVRRFFDHVIAETRKNGYARDRYGRVRFIGAIDSQHDSIRAEAERQACNAVIQGGTAGAIKRAMGNMNLVCRDFRKMGYRVEPWMQIHDALLYAVDAKIGSTFAHALKYTMSNCTRLKVPVIADAEIGSSWAGLTDDEVRWAEIISNELQEVDDV